MTIDRIAFIAIPVILVIGIALWRRHSFQRQYIEQAHKQNLEMQAFLTGRIDAIGQLLADTQISAAELRQKTDAIVSEMESRNRGGDLDALLADTREHLASEIRSRQKA